MSHIFWILSLIGATHIITGTTIFEKWRQLMDKLSPEFFGILFSCPTCIGFWVGVLWSNLLYPIVDTNTFVYNSIILISFIHGCFGSFLGWTANLITQILDEYLTNIQLKNEIIVNNPLEVAKKLLTED